MIGTTYRDAAKPRQLRVAPQGAPEEYSACAARVLKNTSVSPRAKKEISACAARVLKNTSVSPRTIKEISVCAARVL